MEKGRRTGPLSPSSETVLDWPLDTSCLSKKKDGEWNKKVTDD